MKHYIQVLNSLLDQQLKTASITMLILANTVSSDDFSKIEAKMVGREAKKRYVRKEISKQDAISYFQEKDDEYNSNFPKKI